MNLWKYLFALVSPQLISILGVGSRECAVSQELRIAVGVFCEGEEVVDVADFAEVMGRWG